MTGSAAPTPPPDTVDFGYERVARDEKAGRVRAVFDSVASRYDVMNDLMSFGIHRLWKRFLLSQTGLRPGQRALDVAGGTGDITLGMAEQVGSTGLVVLSDITAEMLRQGRDRLLDHGVVGNVEFSLANA
jgi:demethylmenaquinone methyltransferase/2-methoxy-6-polyprenyl-1,4-benzoquinol methylase